jgi:hypothetical protein
MILSFTKHIWGQTQLVCCMGMHNKVSTPMIIDLNDFAMNLDDFCSSHFG